MSILKGVIGMLPPLMVSAASAICGKAPTSGKAAAAPTTARREISGFGSVASLIGSPPSGDMVRLFNGREFLIGHGRGLGPDHDVEAEVGGLVAAVAAGGEIVEGRVE